MSKTLFALSMNAYTMNLYDESPNHWNIMTFLDGEFVSTFRIHVGQGVTAILPSLSTFSDVLGPFVREGRVIVDPTRIAAKLEFAGESPSAVSNDPCRVASGRAFPVELLLLRASVTSSPSTAVCSASSCFVAARLPPDQPRDRLHGS